MSAPSSFALDPRFKIIATTGGASVIALAAEAGSAPGAPGGAAAPKPAKSGKGKPAAGPAAGKAAAAPAKGPAAVSKGKAPEAAPAGEAAPATPAAEEPKSFARRDRLRAIEAAVQARWEEEKTFESDAPAADDGKGKFFVTFPYPYMNGRLHLGHGFSLTKADFSANFHRLLGEHVLFPFSFHCTGMPIQAAANKLKRELEEADDDEEETKGEGHIGLRAPFCVFIFLPAAWPQAVCMLFSTVLFLCFCFCV